MRNLNLFRTIVFFVFVSSLIVNDVFFMTKAEKGTPGAAVGAMAKGLGGLPVGSRARKLREKVTDIRRKRATAAAAVTHVKQQKKAIEEQLKGATGKEEERLREQLAGFTTKEQEVSKEADDLREELKKIEDVESKMEEIEKKRENINKDREKAMEDFAVLGKRKKAIEGQLAIEKEEEKITKLKQDLEEVAREETKISGKFDVFDEELKKIDEEETELKSFRERAKEHVSTLIGKIRKHQFALTAAGSGIGLVGTGVKFLIPEDEEAEAGPEEDEEGVAPEEAEPPAVEEEKEDILITEEVAPSVVVPEKAPALDPQGAVDALKEAVNQVLKRLNAVEEKLKKNTEWVTIKVKDEEVEIVGKQLYESLISDVYAEYRKVKQVYLDARENLLIVFRAYKKGEKTKEEVAEAKSAFAVAKLDLENAGKNLDEQKKEFSKVALYYEYSKGESLVSWLRKKIKAIEGRTTDFEKVRGKMDDILKPLGLKYDDLFFTPVEAKVEGEAEKSKTETAIKTNPAEAVAPVAGVQAAG